MKYRYNTLTIDRLPLKLLDIAFRRATGGSKSNCVDDVEGGIAVVVAGGTGHCSGTARMLKFHRAFSALSALRPLSASRHCANVIRL